MKERIIRAVAGTFVLTSTILSLTLDPHWIWLSVFVGLNLLQSSFSRWCMLEKILNKWIKED
jgi:hypothetical protein